MRFPSMRPVRHALGEIGSEHGVVVILYGNVPVRPSGLIDAAIAKLIESGADSVQSYAPVGKHHPNWMVRVDKHAAVSQYAETSAFRRQDLEPLYLPDGGVIAVRREALDAFDPDEPASFFGRDRRAVITEPGSVVDVDEAFDLLIAEQKLLPRREAHADVDAGARPGGGGRPGGSPC
jgi:CMP-N,N'-diacetyllegionaminic acid synthase